MWGVERRQKTSQFLKQIRVEIVGRGESCCGSIPALKLRLLRCIAKRHHRRGRLIILDDNLLIAEHWNL